MLVASIKLALSLTGVFGQNGMGSIETRCASLSRVQMALLELLLNAFVGVLIYIRGGGRKPWHSINFICAHDGFTLADLVTYNNKNNLSNGEDNNDGENHNNSWNCGQEGEFVSTSVKKLRKPQMRNFFLSLMVSQGVPMIYMGDEYGHTKGGNNNTYCHDNYLNYFRWDKKEESSSDFFRFCRLMTKFHRLSEGRNLHCFEYESFTFQSYLAGLSWIQMGASCRHQQAFTI
ncbi:hypothetical protein GLYMA_05G221851v4 [Glycine max]|uniref:isoamylase 1, chloroplastic isoform X1 n=2 Tax=Glycine max TaxID=3847 RepID=UPI001B355DDD|nr:isoamylase 1, chloroplastic-like isoform X1 [Glycine max]XP_040871607.1 isoamylase 1, chloroplastic-like isoform X1 [Glycine max]KAG4391629.1 hypothetical protein GLYMA_05G221851v4 [Glycine max]KAH1135753.1 hypothetical protein GYH30_013461 [Glycine max]